MTVRWLFAISLAASACRWGFDRRALDANVDDPPLDDAMTTTNIDASITPGASVFGTTAVGPSTQNSGMNRIWMSRFSLAEAGTLKQLVAYIGPGGGQAANVRGVIYAESATVPTTLVATTQTRALTEPAEAWVTMPFAGGQPIAAGTYWLGVHNDNSIQIAYKTNTLATKFASDPFADGADTSWGGGTTTYNMQISIYAEYSVP